MKSLVILNYCLVINHEFFAVKKRHFRALNFIRPEVHEFGICDCRAVCCYRSAWACDTPCGGCGGVGTLENAT